MRNAHAILITLALTACALPEADTSTADLEPASSTGSTGEDGSSGALEVPQPGAAMLGCELHFGGASPSKAAQPWPWLALWYTGADCSTEALGGLEVMVGGELVPATLVQTAVDGEEPCAVWSLGGAAGEFDIWTASWLLPLPPQGGAASLADAPDVQPGWALWSLGEGLGYGATPPDYGPRCAIPLDWYTGDWWPQ